jgi:adenylate cyclase class IV
MKTLDEITCKITTLEETAQLLREKIGLELQKPLKKRRIKYLLFLSKELKTFDFALTQIQWIVS